MSGASDSAALRMDRMYRLQRLIYDPTRRWYLLGRDRLIHELEPPPGGHVLEIACGTGRNLVRIAERYPHARLYGIDVSTEMLKSARAQRRRAGIEGRLALAGADATRFDPVHALDGPHRFERIVIAYALSMIPDWRAALDHALTLLSPGGSLHVVDFDAMERWPIAARAAMRAWLAWFHVTPRPEAGPYLVERARENGATADTRVIAGGYACLTRISLPGADHASRF